MKKLFLYHQLKAFSIPLGLTVEASATDVTIHKKIFGSVTHPFDLAKRTTLIVLNEEMDDIMKVIKSLEESGLLIKGVSETIINEAKEQKGRFHSTLLGMLGASLLGNLLICKGVMKLGEGTIRDGHKF